MLATASCFPFCDVVRAFSLLLGVEIQLNAVDYFKTPRMIPDSVVLSWISHRCGLRAQCLVIGSTKATFLMLAIGGVGNPSSIRRSLWLFTMRRRLHFVVAFSASITAL
jgi:hypothetical protein